MMLWQLAREDAFADKYKRFMQLEAKATVQYAYSVGAIHGLLQTEGYAREVFQATRPRDENELSEDTRRGWGDKSCCDVKTLRTSARSWTSPCCVGRPANPTSGRGNWNTFWTRASCQTSRFRCCLSMRGHTA